MSSESKWMMAEGRCCWAEPFTFSFSGGLKNLGRSLVGMTRRGPREHISSAHVPLPDPLTSSPTKLHKHEHNCKNILFIF